MKRLHVHVSVSSLDESIKFYSTMFASEPTVVKSDYAKWMLEDPRVNFAISQRSAVTGLNHLGMQVESTEELAAMHERLEKLEGELIAEEGAACCYAKSDKYWTEDPQGIAWETFHTLDSIPVFGVDSASANASNSSSIGADASDKPLKGLDAVEACGCTPRRNSASNANAPATTRANTTAVAAESEPCCGPTAAAGACC